MGLGGIYAGIGLAQGLGQASKNYTDAKTAAEENERKKQKEDLEMKIAQKSYDKDIESDELSKDLFGSLSKGLTFESTTPTTPTTGKGLKDIVTPAPKANEGLIPADSLNEQGMGYAPEDLVMGQVPDLAKMETDKVSLETFTRDAQKIKDFAKEARQKANRQFSLTQNSNLLAQSEKMIEEFENENASRLKALAGNDLKKISILINSVSDQSGLYLENIMEGKESKDTDGDGEKELYILRDAQGNAVSRVSALELSSLGTGAGVKQFMADKRAEAADIRKQKRELDAKIQEATIKYGFDSKLATQSDNARLKAQRELSAMNLKLAYLELFGSEYPDYVAMANAIKTNKRSITGSIQSKGGVVQPLVPTATQEATWLKTFIETKGDEQAANRAAFGPQYGLDAEVNIKYGPPLSEGARTRNEMANLNGGDDVPPTQNNVPTTPGTPNTPPNNGMTYPPKPQGL